MIKWKDVPAHPNASQSMYLRREVYETDLPGNALSWAQPLKPDIVLLMHTRLAGRPCSLITAKVWKNKSLYQKWKTLRATGWPGPLLVLKAGVQNEAKQNHLIHVYSFCLGCTKMPERASQYQGREMPYKSIWSGHRKRRARDQVGISWETVVPSTWCHPKSNSLGIGN